jgi:hypothetical protein
LVEALPTGSLALSFEQEVPNWWAAAMFEVGVEVELEREAVIEIGVAIEVEIVAIC